MGNSVSGSALSGLLFEKEHNSSSGTSSTERDHLLSEAKQDPSLKSLWNATTTKRKMLLLFLACGRFSTSFCASIPSPFLARVVRKRGGSLIHATLIMQIMQVVMALVCGLFGKYQARLRCKILFFSGIILYGICQAIFGFVEFIKDIDVFIGCALAIKVVQGVGLGGYMAALITIVCQEFTDSLWYVFTIIELAFGIGYFLGPLIGGIFFTLSGGLLVPCITSGLIILLSCSSGFVILKGFVQRESTEPDCCIWKCVFNGKSFILLGIAATISGSFGIIDATLTTYLLTLGYTVMDTGIAMFTSTIFFCPGIVLSRHFSKVRRNIRIATLILSVLVVTVNSLLFSHYASQGLIYGASIIIRGSGSIALVLALNEFMARMVCQNPHLEEHVVIAIARLRIWVVALGIGCFVIPVVCAVLEQSMTFSISMLLSLSGGLLFTLLAAIVMTLITICVSRG